MEPVLMILVGVLAVAAVALFVTRNGTNERLRDLEKRVQEAEKSRVAAEAEARTRRESLEGRTGELTELREKLRDAKRKLHEEKEVARKHDIDHARAQAERDAQTQIESARREAAELQQEVRRLKAEMDVKGKGFKKVEREPRAESAPAAAAAPTPARVEAPSEPRPPRELTEVEQNRISLLERQAVKQAEKLKHSDDELRKANKRAETNNKVYLVAKSELDLTRSRMTALEKRLNKSLLELDKVRQLAFKAGLGSELVAAQSEAPAAPADMPAPNGAVSAPSATESAQLKA